MCLPQMWEPCGTSSAACGGGLGTLRYLLARLRRPAGDSSGRGFLGEVHAPSAKHPQFADSIDIDSVSVLYDSDGLMAPSEESPGGAWFVASRSAEVEHSGAGAVSACRVCGEAVWVDAGDAALAESCAAIACPHCTQTVHGILYIPTSAPGATSGVSADDDVAPTTARILPPGPRCGGCGQPVEAHEPARIEQEDGTVHPSSMDSFDEAARRDAWRLWHVGCFPGPA